MREILFRGKRCDNGEWVQGFYLRADHHWHKNGIHKDWIALGASANGGWFALHNKYAVKAETVGQFTGLTDKNGKKVFENDIIVICYETDGEEFTETKRVHYNEKECCWYPMRWEECCEHCDHYTEVKSIEVIGNIHDNPELLKEAPNG